jgi:hypothetical protein
MTDITSTISITQANIYLLSTGSNALDVVIQIMAFTAILVLFAVGVFVGRVVMRRAS